MIEGLRQLLSTWAESPVLRDGDMAGCQEMAARLGRSYPAYLGVTATDGAGVIRCATMQAALGLSTSESPHARLARETGGFAVGEFVLRRDTSRPALSFAMPYRNRAGAPAGFIIALVDLSGFEHYLADQLLPVGAAFTIADRHGTVLARTPEVAGAAGNPLPEPYRPLLEAAQSGSVDLAGLDGVMRVQGYVPPATGAQGLFVMVGLGKAAALAPIRGTLWRSLGGLCATTLLALAVAWWGTRRYLRGPVRALVAATERWRDGDYTSRAGIRDGGSELVALGSAFDAMAESLEAYNRARDEAYVARRKVAEVFDCITDGVFEVDRDWRITFMNERARNGAAGGQDQVGMILWDAYPELVGSRFWHEDHRSMTERVPIEVEDYYAPHQKWYRVRAFPSREGLAIYFQDVTERRRLQEDLSRQQTLLETVIESAPDPIFAKDREGHCITLNSAAAGVLGHPRQTIIGSTDADMFPLEIATVMRDQEMRIMETGVTEVLEESIPDRHHGEPRVFLTTKTPLRDPVGAVVGIIGVSRDITERKAREEALRQAKEEAERANLAKSKFLAAASHDLRQPLQSLTLFTGVLRGHVQSARGQQALQHLEHGLDTLKALLDSLLDVSRLDAGIVKPEITEFPVSAVLDGIDASYGPAAAAKGLGWQVETCTEAVRTDMTLLGRVLRNLVENAVRYTRSGHIRIACRRIEDRLRVAVEDTGIGIPPGQLEQIFEEFHQVDNQARDRSQGLGLGLAIVRRIADLLGHRVETRSRPGEGSTFSVELPLAMTGTMPVPTLSGGDSSEQDGQGRLVVVIDDDTLVLTSLEAILTEWRYEVIAAISAEEAVAQVRNAGRRPDIVLADYRLLDGRTGTEAVVAIRALFDHPIPGLILTGETDLQFLRACADHDLGIAYKPVMPAQLGRALEQQLNAAA
ncbi:PAS domain-containing protein (plasmid) [Skermanella mucosa]|uniref:PAS domain-containing protein n=1 Tax=Skermanella mucosa TaxID=1789672 RepID=UPI00192B4700